MPQQKIPLNPIAERVLEHRFLRKNDQDKLTETPEQLFRKVARNIAIAEIKYKLKPRIKKLLEKHNQPENEFWYLPTKTKELNIAIKKDKDIKNVEEEFADLLSSLDFLPSSTILANAAGTQQLAETTTIPIKDSITGIFDALYQVAHFHQTGTSTGLSFSQIRPNKDQVKSTNSNASGPVSFMHIFDVTAQQLKRGSKQYGTTTATLDIEHPNIEEFIYSLSTFTAVQPAITITDKFMQAAEKGTNIQLTNPQTGKMVERHDAQQLLNTLCLAATQPGTRTFFFTDTANKSSPLQKVSHATTVSSNIPLHDYNATVAGSINLANMVVNNAIDLDHLKKRVHQAIHFLDNAIDMANLLFEETFEETHNNRSIALGVMGFADMLFQLNIRYSSDKAVTTAEEVMAFITTEAKQASINLAKQRGTFSNFSKTTHAKAKQRIRNAICTSILPNNTISTIAGCSNGIQPVESIVHKHQLGDEKVIEANPYFIAKTKSEGVYSQKIIKKILETGTLKGAFVAVGIKKVFITESEVTVGWKTKIQAAFQKNCDGSVSQVISMHNPTAEEIKNAITRAHDTGCHTLTLRSTVQKEEKEGEE